jgi:hypothetical protein
MPCRLEMGSPPAESRGALGVLDVRLFGIALLVRWLWLQCTELDRA